MTSHVAAEQPEDHHFVTLYDKTLNMNFIYISAGAGVDENLIDHLDAALTAYPPDERVFLLIERKPQPNGDGTRPT